jgi:hypothetical protein
MEIDQRHIEDRVRALSAVATPGPWDEDCVSEEFRSAAGDRADADSELVVLLRNKAEAIADLVAAVREMHGVISAASANDRRAVVNGNRVAPSEAWPITEHLMGFVLALDEAASRG